MKSRLLPLFVLAAVIGLAPSAEAIQFTSSTTTGQNGLMFPFRMASPLAGPLSLEAGLRFAPSLSTFLGPAQVTPGYNELSSSLFDAHLNLLYNWQIADVEFLGHFTPTLSPYVGVRYMGVPTTEGSLSLSGAGAALSYSQFAGLNYGVRASTELPLGFSAFSFLGLTTLMSGGWDTRAGSTDVTGAGKVAVGGATLPSFGLGAGWSLFDVISLYVGYEGFALPTGLRTQGTRLPSEQTWLNTLTVGGRVLLLSF